MNALIRKEVRLLLPSWSASVLLALSIWLLPSNLDSGWRQMLVVLPMMVCPGLLVIMTLSSFGREITSQTFSNLLAQPVSRTRIWWTKTLLLAAAVAIVWAVWWFSLIQNRNFQANAANEGRYAFVLTVLMVVAAYSGGLWTVLLFRQVAAAFWFTLLAPATILMMVNYVFQRYSEQSILKLLIAAFCAYGGGGFVFARWLFLRAQDVAWTGGTVTLPGWGKSTSAVPKVGAHRRRPWRALFAKEIQLHHSQLIIAGLLALLHLAVIATRKFGGDFKSSPVLDAIVGGFWVLWFVMPLLVGCDAVAEERKLGTLESQLCLPARRRTQFMIKFVTTLLLSVLLGAAAPVLFEGTRILPPRPEFSHYATTTPTAMFLLAGDFITLFGKALPFLTFAGIAALIATISFYASTLARSTVQALAPAVLGIVLAGISLGSGDRPEDLIQVPLWRGWLGYLIGAPVTTLALAGLMYWNFKRVLVGWSVWRRNAFVLIGTFAFVITSAAAIYHRAWELVGPQEPSHGPARLTASQIASVKSDGATVFVHLSDGRVCAKYVPTFPQPFVMPQPFAWYSSKHGGYIDGTNWASLDKGLQDLVGIQKDGSLWALSNPEILDRRWTGPSPAWTRVGNENDWKSLAVYGPQAFLLKTNGTLWRLGTNGLPGQRPWPGLVAFTPQQLGTDSDWADISSSASRRVIFRRSDGAVWVSPAVSMEEEKMELQPDLTIHRAPYFDGYKSTTEVFGPRGLFAVGIHDDGTFRVNATIGNLPFRENNRRVRHGLVSTDIPLDGETNWLAVAGNLRTVVALKADGSLWKADGSLWKWNWDFPRPHVTTLSPVRLGSHSDWLAVVSVMDGTVSLAADGTLWLWRFDTANRYSNGAFEPLLKVPRRPRLLGNIFNPPAQ